MKTIRKTSLPCCLIIIVAFFFVANVAYETYDNMEQKFSITDTQSMNCFIEFQRMSCRIQNLTSECAAILDCIQKDDVSSLPIKMFAFIDFIIEEIIENVIPPLVIVVLTMIYQLTTSITELRKE